MDTDQIHALKNSCSLPGSCSDLTLKETHISWIIMSDDYAFKIKRPVKYTFLDFSTPEKRKHFCKEELKLNRRLAPEMYLDILPVTNNMLKKTSGKKEKEIIDHAVWMKRMDNSLEMDNLLETGKVTTVHIDKLAEKVAGFHDRTQVVKKPGDIDAQQELYADIKTIIPYLNEKGYRFWENKIHSCIESSENFLKKNKDLLDQRVDRGFHRDGHGDLNSRNIFLYDDPLIFDCIEFNAGFRQIDVLNEIAFLCMDLEFFGQEDLSNLFYQKYLFHSGIEDEPFMRRLFSYYKGYRANVKAKVTILGAQKKEKEEKIYDPGNALKYLSLMHNYKAG